MEGLHKEKTAYLETLENLFHELTQARSMSSSGRKLVLLGLLYDVHRVHQFFLQIENNLSESIDIRNILQYDADVDYNEWNVKLDMKFDVKAFYMPDEEAKEADPVSVKTTLEHVFDTFSRDELKNILCDRTNKVQFMMAILMNDLSVDQLVLVLNESVVALRESLVHIQACINKHRMTLEEGKELYRHEKEIFVREHESKVIEKFEKWKDTFDGDEDVIKRNLKGKYCTEILAFFMSGFLAPRIDLQGETDTTEFEKEYEEVCFYNYPKDMNLKAHYSALREIFEYKDKMIVPKKGHIGKYFFKYRKEVDTKQRIALFSFIKMIELIEEEKKPKEEKVELNYEGIKIAMTRTYFPKFAAALADGYDSMRLKEYIDTLMDSAYKDELATDWRVENKRDTIVCLLIGALKEAGVFMGNYSSLAKMLNKDNVKTLAKYMGNAKRHAITDWTKEYIEGK